MIKKTIISLAILIAFVSIIIPTTVVHGDFRLGIGKTIEIPAEDGVWEIIGGAEFGSIANGIFTGLERGTVVVRFTRDGIERERTIIVGEVDPIVLLGRVIGFVRNILILVAVLFILFGAFTFITASGDDAKIEKGRKAIMYALIAVVIAVLAHGLVSWAAGWAGRM